MQCGVSFFIQNLDSRRVSVRTVGTVGTRHHNYHRRAYHGRHSYRRRACHGRHSYHHDKHQHRWDGLEPASKHTSYPGSYNTEIKNNIRNQHAILEQAQRSIMCGGLWWTSLCQRRCAEELPRGILICLFVAVLHAAEYLCGAGVIYYILYIISYDNSHMFRGR